MAAAKPQTKTEAPKVETPKQSVLAEYMVATRDLASDVETANAKVGGDIARGHGARAIELLKQAAIALQEAVLQDA